MLVGYSCLLNKNLQVIHLGRKIAQIKETNILVCLKQKIMSTLSITDSSMRVTQQNQIYPKQRPMSDRKSKMV